MCPFALSLLLVYWVRAHGVDPAKGVDPGTMVNDAVGYVGLICVIIALYVGYRSGAAGREMAAYLCRQWTGVSLAKLSAVFGLEHPDSSPPMKILLAGQDHLRQTLKRSEYTDIVNRISVRYQLRPLTKDQTRRYIDFQMSEHGGDVKVFDDGAKDLIHDFTGGNPRSINTAAVACLMGATSRRQLRVDEEMFRSVSSELVLH